MWLVDICWFGGDPAPIPPPSGKNSQFSLGDFSSSIKVYWDFYSRYPGRGMGMWPEPAHWTVLWGFGSWAEWCRGRGSWRRSFPVVVPWWDFTVLLLLLIPGAAQAPTAALPCSSASGAVHSLAVNPLWQMGRAVGDWKASVAQMGRKKGVVWSVRRQQMEARLYRALEATLKVLVFILKPVGAVEII